MGAAGLIAMATVVLAVPSLLLTGASQMPAPSQSRWAIVVGRQNPNVVGAQRALAGALLERYGYKPTTVFQIYGTDATRGAIRELFAGLEKRVRPGDSLFVYILLPVLERKDTEYFLPEDGRESEVWTLIGREELDETIAALPVLTSLTVVSGCLHSGLSPGSKSLAVQTQAVLRGGGGRASALTFCDRSAPDLGAERFAVAFSQILASPAGSRERVSDVDIEAALRGSLRGMEVQLSRPGGRSVNGFDFLVERRRADALLEQLSANSGVEQQVETIESLSALVRSSADAAMREAVIAGIARLAANPTAGQISRLRAIGALGEMGQTDTIPALKAISTRDGAPEFRRAAVAALARIDDGASLQALFDVMRDEDATVRAAAIRGAGGHKRLATAAPIVAAISDPDAGVKVAALQAVAILAVPKQVGRNIITPVASSARQAAQRTLSDRSPDVQREAVNVLALLGVDLARDRTAIRLLTSDGDASVRRTVALTLGREYRRVWEARRSGDDYKLNAQQESALTALIRVAGNAPPDVRAAAIWAIGKSGDRRGNQVLLESLGDGDVRVVEAAIEALGSLRHRPAIPAIIALLEHDSVRVRNAAARALQSMPSVNMAEPLMARFSRETDVYVRKALEDALHALPPPSLQTLAAELASDLPKVRREAVERLDKSSEPEAAQLALEMLRDEDIEVRDQALKVVQKRSLEWFEDIVAATDSQHPAVRFGTVLVLGELHTAATGDVLLRRLEPEQNPAIKVAIIDALGSVRPIHEEIEAALIRMTQQPDPALRAAAADALRSYPGSSARAALFTLLEDDDPAVRQSAIASFRYFVK